VTTCDDLYYKVDNSDETPASSDTCEPCPQGTTVNVNDNTICDGTCYQWNEVSTNACSSSQVLKSGSRNIVGSSDVECCDYLGCGNGSIDCSHSDNPNRNQIKRVGTCSEDASTSQADAQACAEADALDDRTACEGIMKEVDDSTRACTYTEVLDTQLGIGDDIYSTCCRGETCADWISETDDANINVNTCDASSNRYYCSQNKDAETDPSETTCCLDNGCPCNSLDADSVCDPGYTLGNWEFVPNDDTSKLACCVDPDSFQVSIMLNATCEQLNTLCDGDSSNDGNTLSEIGALITGGTGVISQIDCDQLPSDCISCLNRVCDTGKVLVSNPTCTGGTTASPICTDLDCCTDGQTCSGYDCSGFDKSLDPNPDSITCSGATCTELECCTEPFTNMEGFQNNYNYQVNMENTYLIEGVENQRTFEIPVRIMLEPKDDTVELLSQKDVNRRIDDGISIPELGINIEKSISRRNQARHQKKEDKDKYKIIGIITGIGVLAIFLLYLIRRYKQRNPLQDLLS